MGYFTVFFGLKCYSPKGWETRSVLVSSLFRFLLGDDPGNAQTALGEAFWGGCISGFMTADFQRPFVHNQNEV